MISKRKLMKARNHRMYRLHHEEEYTYQEIADMYKLSRARVGQIMMQVKRLTNA